MLGLKFYFTSLTYNILQWKYQRFLLEVRREGTIC